MTRENLIKATMRALTSTGWRGDGSGGGQSWTCDPAYLVDAAGTWVCNVGSRVFNKYTDGLAIAVLTDHVFSTWVGPALISTVKEHTYTTQGPGQAVQSFQYLGLTWYWSGSYWLHNAEWSSGVPVISSQDCTYPDTVEGAIEMAKFILTKAHVRIGNRGGFMTLWP